MINFPIFEELKVTNYGLYPGPKTSANGEGLHIKFDAGLKLIVGANGLGKSTLVNILYRLLAGPFDIPGISSGAELGNRDLAPRRIAPAERRMFADRVADGAAKAEAELTFKLGEVRVVITRSLKNLELLRLQVDGQTIGTDETSVFQARIAELVGVWSFSDWILLLRHLIFYFEDRRALVWDASAQRQMLRFLFLPARTAQKWTESERWILDEDSDTRNLQYAISNEETALLSSEGKVKESADVRQELKTLQNLQKVDNIRAEELDGTILQLEARREKARLRFVKAEQEREARYRELERAKLSAIEARFPKTSDTARYIVAQILAEATCLVCGSHVPSVAAEFEGRIAKHACVICSSNLTHADVHIPQTSVADRRVKKASAELRHFEPELANADTQLKAVESEYNLIVIEATTLSASIKQRSAQIDSLIRRLPPDEAELHRQREEVGGMRTRLATRKRELEKARKEFSKFIEVENRKLAAKSGGIKKSFDSYAEGFLLEQCTLFWSPHKARLGQTGDLMDFPAFELELTGTDFPSAMRRTGPEQVSESQREFIDLAFRMSLMEVSGAGGVGTLVIDAPESSLDAVFVSRAANVLARFAKPSKGNRLIITSNLVEGELIPELLILSTKEKKRLSHLVNLFEIAEPTAAIRKLRDEYRSVYNALIRRVTGAKPKKRRK